MTKEKQKETLGLILANQTNIELESFELDPNLVKPKLVVTIKRPVGNTAEITNAERTKAKERIEQKFQDATPPVEITVK